MQPLGLNEIREKYLSFFESKAHMRMNSFSVIPQNDNSLLLINSGMAPLKPYFTGQEIPPSKRVTTCQKCIRTGDIENVGKTARHGTFFEMLGNFSFGDYFKNEIIPWAWEFVTEVLNIPEQRLFISVYEQDDETYTIWHEQIGIPENKIFRMGKEDNFWEVGTGPCGPCSEIYYDRGEQYGCGKSDCTVGCDCDRYMEFWNLVFTQFSKQDDGSYVNLAHPNIDTGMGLERMAVIMQDVYSIFDVDTVKAVRDAVCEKVAGLNYGENETKDISIRVITDHVRSMVIMASDGVLPSNEGRGYVLRRLLRRAARHGRLLGIEDMFLSELSKVAIEVSKDAYPELKEKQDYIVKVLSFEEERFYETLDIGMRILKSYIQKLREEHSNIMKGDMSFKLYDTYGFPPDLTQEILEEVGMALDEISFQKEMKKQRELAQAAHEDSNYMGAEQTVFESLPKDLETAFAGYDKAQIEAANVQLIVRGEHIVESAGAGDEITIFVDLSPFYAESGGQVGDTGLLESTHCKAVITNCFKTKAGKIGHTALINEGSIRVSDMVTMRIDAEKRMATQRNHSCTHLLQKALREVLGTHVEQAGSLVTPERLRFDFTHFAAMTENELQEVEMRVNDKILAAYPISAYETSIDEARAAGAMALFGEKYGELVRVVKMGDFSIELCGGCHMGNTSQAGSFKLLSESGIAAGVRRIEALTGREALLYYRKQDELIRFVSVMAKTTPDNLLDKLKGNFEQQKTMVRELEELRSKMSGNVADDIVGKKTVQDGVNIVCENAGDMDAAGLRSMGDQLRDKLRSGVICLAGVKTNKVYLLAMATKDVVEKGIHCGEIVKAAAMAAGGNGGGRPDMAQAGAKDPAKTDESLKAALNKIQQQLKG